MGSANVSALVACAEPSRPDDGTRPRRAAADGSSPFRAQVFDDPREAVAEGLQLLRMLPRRGGPEAIRVAISTGPETAALADATALAAAAPPGTIMLTSSAMEALGRHLPDGMALRPEMLDVGQERMTAFELRSAAAVVPHSLPHVATRLIGRLALLTELRDLLEDERLISLTGPPGSGKTRLASELGRSLLGTFADGVWFVPLAPIQSPELIAPAVARTLGLNEEAGRSMAEVVGAHLGTRESLLIVDNFEHVLEGAMVVSEWLAAAPHLRVVATSRAPLRLSGERVFEVPPLALPAGGEASAIAESESVQLFCERARAVARDFDPDPAAFDDIAGICRRLDGLPLALELAAARTRALPAAAILGRLERSLELLTQSARDVPEHHRSLHAALSWSYGLLTPAERTFLCRLTVFRGGWGLDAADAVARATDELDSDPLQLTTSLLDESLIRRQVESRDEPRYDMLETLREFGREKLIEAGEADEIAERHARWFLELAERAAPSLTGPDSGTWLDQLEREIHNFRAALQWTIDRGRVDLGMRMAAALWRFWQIRGHIGEGRGLIAQLLALGGDVSPAVRASALSAAGSLAYWHNDGAAAVTYYEAAVELRRGGDDPAELAAALYDLGHALSALDQVRDLERGRILEHEALEIHRTLGNPIGVAWLTWALGCNSHFAEAHVAADEELSTSVELFRALDNQFGLAWSLTMSGLAAARLNHRDRAGASWREALEIFAAVEDVSGIDTVLEHLARLALASDDPRRAIRLATAAARVRGRSESGIAEIAYGVLGDGAFEGIPLDPEEIAAMRREGEAMSMAEAVAYALTDGDAEGAGHLRVHALGPMRVERRGVAIRRWGGEKAGARQAQAIFAFLFDRGADGIAKDEVTELLWPDVEIRRGDLAFHRTLGALRSVLGEGETITYDGGRYRLAPQLIGWSDVTAFEEMLDGAATADAGEAVRALEEARGLYRGDLFDDCPVYGDSAEVEGRRAYLRGRFEDLLVTLGDRYVELGDPRTAAARYRQALGVNPESAAARDGLERAAAVLGPDPA